MTKETKERIIENIQPFKRGVVSVYMSSVAKAKLDRMAKELTLSSQGRSATLEAMINFACDNEQDFAAFFRYNPNQEKGEENDESQL